MTMPQVPFVNPQAPPGAPGYLSNGPQGQQQQPQQPPVVPPYPTQPTQIGAQYPPNVGYPQAQIPQQQPQSQQVPQPQAQPASAPQGLDPNAIIQPGPGIPPELVGRKVEDLLRYYQGLRTHVLEQQRSQQQMPPQQFGRPQATPAQVAPQPQQPQGAPRSLWSDPKAFIADTVQEVMGPMLQPVLQSVAQNQVTQVQQQLTQRYPDFQQFLPGIMQNLDGVPPEMLVNPSVWEMAYLVERGRASLSAPAVATGPRVIAPPAVGYNAQQGQPTFIPPATPAPTQQFAQPTLTAAEDAIRQRMGISADDYLRWKNGGGPTR